MDAAQHAEALKLAQEALAEHDRIGMGQKLDCRHCLIASALLDLSRTVGEQQEKITELERPLRPEEYTKEGRHRKRRNK